MKLDNVTAEIRPRGRWESIDLGCALVRENFTKIMLAWLAVVFPIWFTIIALSHFWPWPEGRPWIAGLVCLWIVPFCDKVPLFILSRRLFGEDCNLRHLYREMPKMICRKFFRTILAGPLNLSRGFTQPVSELEGLKGRAYSDRVNLLYRNGGEGASQAALMTFVLVLAMMFSFFFVFLSLLSLFGNSVELEEFWSKYIIESDAAFIAIPYVWATVVLALVAVSMIEPFYVGAGFAIYINSRTITEGWDIEIAFKRMSKRLQSVKQNMAKSAVMILSFCITLGSDTATADASNNRLENVLQKKEFEIKSETILVPKGNKKPATKYNSQSIGNFAAFIEILTIVIVVSAISIIIWYIYSNRDIFKGTYSVASKSTRTSRVMGMDISPESIPKNVVEAAKLAWAENDPQLAMSYLYRGSISWIVNEMGVAIDAADTENDCLRRVNNHEKGHANQYFASITKHWIQIAYAGNILSDEEFSALCTSWPYSSQSISDKTRK